MCSGSKNLLPDVPLDNCEVNSGLPEAAQPPNQPPELFTRRQILPSQVPDLELHTFSWPLKTLPALGSGLLCKLKKKRIAHMKLDLAGDLICSSPRAGCVDK